MGDMLTMSKKELTRLEVIQRIQRRELRQVPLSLKQQIKEIICQKYPDFGPTLLWDKLTELHNLDICTGCKVSQTIIIMC